MAKKLKLPTPNPYSAKSDTEVNLEWAMNQKGRAARTAAFAMVDKRRGQTREENPNYRRYVPSISERENPGGNAFQLDQYIKSDRWHDFVPRGIQGAPLSGRGRGKVRG